MGTSPNYDSNPQPNPKPFFSPNSTLGLYLALLAVCFGGDDCGSGCDGGVDGSCGGGDPGIDLGSGCDGGDDTDCVPRTQLTYRQAGTSTNERFSTVDGALCFPVFTHSSGTGVYYLYFEDETNTFFTDNGCEVGGIALLR